MSMRLGLHRARALRWAEAVAWTAFGLALFLLLIRLCTHALFYDETLHIRFASMLASELEPHTDFWCPYPVLGYALTLPLIQRLPDSAYAVLALRLVSVGLFAALCGLSMVFMRSHGGRVGLLLGWAMLASIPSIGRFIVEYSVDPFAAFFAMSSMVLLLSKPSPTRLAAAALFAGLSVVATPKYALPLAFGLLGAVLAAESWRHRFRQLLLATTAGLVGIASAAILIQAAGCSFFANLHYGILMMSRFNLLVVASHEHYPHAWLTLFRSLQHEPWLALLLIAGVCAWIPRLRTASNARFWPAMGLLVGVAWMALRLRSVLEQYMLPLYVVLILLFAPEIGRWLAQRPWRAIACAMGVVLLLGIRIPVVASEWSQTPVNARDERNPLVPEIILSPPVVKQLTDLDRLLQVIPKEDTVVALWIHHPLFRRDASRMTADDRPSFRYLLDADDPALAFFSAQYFREQLEARPPAYIHLGQLSANYPPGWSDVCEAFLLKATNLYHRLDEAGASFLRSDLYPAYQRRLGP